MPFVYRLSQHFFAVSKQVHTTEQIRQIEIQIEYVTFDEFSSN